MFSVEVVERVYDTGPRTEPCGMPLVRLTGADPVRLLTIY